VPKVYVMIAPHDNIKVIFKRLRSIKTNKVSLCTILFISCSRNSLRAKLT